MPRLPARQRPSAEPGTYLHTRRELDEASASILKILEAAPRATSKYKDVGAAGRAVLKALSAAVRDYNEAESGWVRWERQKVRDR